MGCPGVHCNGCGGHSGGGSGGGSTVGIGSLVLLILVFVYSVNRHAIDHAADVAIDTLVIILIAGAGLSAAGLTAVLTVAAIRHRSARPQRAGLAHVRGEVLAEPDSEPEPLTGQPVLRALPSPDSRSAGRSALRPGRSQPARTQPGRTWPHLR